MLISFCEIGVVRAGQVYQHLVGSPFWALQLIHQTAPGFKGVMDHVVNQAFAARAGINGNAYDLFGARRLLLGIRGLLALDFRRELEDLP